MHLALKKEPLLITYSADILVCLLTVKKPPKNRKCAAPFLVTLLKLRCHDSQSSHENATQYSGTSPLASYKKVWYLNVTAKHSLLDVFIIRLHLVLRTAKRYPRKNTILLGTAEDNTRHNQNHGWRKIKSASPNISRIGRQKRNNGFFSYLAKRTLLVNYFRKSHQKVRFPFSFFKICKTWKSSHRPISGGHEAWNLAHV